MSDEEQKYGLEGIEQAQGYEPMPMAQPDPEPEPAIDSDSALAKHLQRPAPPEPTTREYTDAATGTHRPDNEVVEMDRAAEDLANIRRQENLELEKQHNSDLNEALDFLQQEQSALADATTPRPVEQQPTQEPQPALTPEQFQAMSLEERNALFETNQAIIQEADRQLQAVLADPIIREKIESEFSAVKTQAAAEVQQARAAYQQVIAQNANAGLAALNASFPELAGMNAEQIQGALRLMQPQRAEQYRQHVGLVSNLIAAHQQQAAQAQAQQLALQAQQRERAAQQLEQYRLAEVKRYEEATAHENPETMRTLRENAFPMIEKHYGVPETTMRALASGQQRVDSAALLHSSAFQLMITDALKYRMAQQSVGKAVTRPVPQVQRPGISEPVRIDDGAVASALARLNQPGGNEGRQGLKNAAALVAARRGNR
jgi:hypothetical protein